MTRDDKLKIYYHDDDTYFGDVWSVLRQDYELGLIVKGERVPTEFAYLMPKLDEAVKQWEQER